MNIFKKKKNKPDVCGYLDLNGKFYTDKYERDIINKRLKKEKAFREVENEFNDIIYNYRKRELDHEREFLKYEPFNGGVTCKADFDLKYVMKNMNKKDKSKLLELYAKYIKLSENEE